MVFDKREAQTNLLITHWLEKPLLESSAPVEAVYIAFAALAMRQTQMGGLCQPVEL